MTKHSSHIHVSGYSYVELTEYSREWIVKYWKTYNAKKERKKVFLLRYQLTFGNG